MKNLLTVKALNNCCDLDFWETYFKNGKSLSVLVDYAEIRTLKNKTERMHCTSPELTEEKLYFPF